MDFISPSPLRAPTNEMKYPQKSVATVEMRSKQVIPKYRVDPAASQTLCQTTNRKIILKTYSCFFCLLVAMPMGQMPVLEVDGKRVHQSLAMCRYVAKQIGLAGNDALEDLQVDAIVDTINEFRLSECVNLLNGNLF